MFEHPLILLQTTIDILAPFSLASNEATFLLVLIALISFGTLYSQTSKIKHKLT